MNLIDNSLNDSGVIESFSKEEIIDIKNTLLKLKSKNADESEVRSFIELNLKVPSTLLESYSEYLDKIEGFLNMYLVNIESDLNSFYYFHLKSGILKELNHIIKDLQNLNSNCANIKRILKNGDTYIDAIHSNLKNLLRQGNDVASIIINSLREVQNLYDNHLHMWIEINK
ncbi:MAG: hypothetical protein ACFFFB_21160, partial [Candidatus Heimdallarchaeota archaeon]